MEANEIRNVQQLRQRLSATWNSVEAGTIDVRQADTLANISGKMLKSVAVELEYAALRGDKPSIPFLDGDAKGE